MGSTGQMLLTMGALILMSIIMLNNNSAMMSTDETLDDNRYRMEALSILTSHIEQLGQYYFDEASTDTLNPKTLASFTPPGQLGFEPNDSSVIDDIDDVNNLVVIDTGRSGVPYAVRFRVDYVTPHSSGFYHAVGTRYHKRIQLWIHDTFPTPLIVNEAGERDSIYMAHVISYWFFN